MVGEAFSDTVGPLNRLFRFVHRQSASGPNRDPPCHSLLTSTLSSFTRMLLVELFSELVNRESSHFGYR